MNEHQSDPPDVFARIRKHWADAGVELLPPAEEQDIVDTFGKNGQFGVSRDVIRLYRTVGGFGSWDQSDPCFKGWPDDEGLASRKMFGWDADLFCLWPLERVRIESARYAGREVCFADYSLCCHYFSIRHENADESAVIGHRDSPEDEPLFLCPSLVEFFNGFLRDPLGAVLGFPRPGTGNSRSLDPLAGG